MVVSGRVFVGLLKAFGGWVGGVREILSPKDKPVRKIGLPLIIVGIGVTTSDCGGIGLKIGQNKFTGMYK